MMNGRERSDSAIVAVKPTNKAGQPGAESGEPRAGTKGNMGQQSTRRAQNRESVSQALDRVRTAARHRKKERFTTLFHHLSIDLFREAFLALRRDAAPVHFAFRVRYRVGTRDEKSFAAPYLAYALPYRRFAVALTDASARLGADVVRYSFIVVD